MKNQINVKTCQASDISKFSGVKAKIDIDSIDGKELILKKLSSVSWAGGDRAVQRWLKHLSEYITGVYRISGTYVSLTTLDVTREVEQSLTVECDYDPLKKNIDSIGFQISNDEIIELLTNSNLYENESCYEECSEINENILPRPILVEQTTTVPICNNCHGTGKSPCPECNGTGEEVCLRCHGTGEGEVHKDEVGEDVYYDNGERRTRKLYSTRVSNCSRCHGRGYRQCSNCYGQKLFVCEDCKGTGREQGATKAWNIEVLRETYRLFKRSKILCDNGNWIDLDGFILQKPTEDDIIAIFSNIEEGKPAEVKISTANPNLADFINEKFMYILNADQLTDDQYYVGGALVTAEISSIIQVSIDYDNFVHTMYIIGNNVIYDGELPGLSFWEDILKRYKKKSRGENWFEGGLS